MKRLTIEGIILKNVNYKDSHKIYTILTKEKGKISAIARGVRKISSRRSGNLDSLNEVKLSIGQDKSGFYTINEVSVINSYNTLKHALEFILTAMYFVELLDVFMESDHENLEAYKLLKSAFTVLSKNPERPEILVNVFEIRMLEMLGLGLDTRNIHGELLEIFGELKSERNLTNLNHYNLPAIKRIDSLIKDHLKKMVETYARFPRINSFLAEHISI